MHLKSLKQKGRLTWVIRVWLNTVHHMPVPLEYHDQFRAVFVPYEDAPTITAAENKILTPKISFLDLQKECLINETTVVNFVKFREIKKEKRLLLKPTNSCQSKWRVAILWQKHFLSGKLMTCKN